MSKQLHCRILVSRMLLRQSRTLRRHCCRFWKRSTCCQNGNNVERVFREISPFRQSRNKLNMFNLFRLCWKNRSSCSIRQCWFDIVAGVPWTGLKGRQKRSQWTWLVNMDVQNVDGPCRLESPSTPRKHQILTGVLIHCYTHAGFNIRLVV